MSGISDGLARALKRVGDTWAPEPNNALGGFTKAELMGAHLIEMRASEERGVEFRRTSAGRLALGMQP